jgi:hypothetical protein
MPKSPQNQDVGFAWIFQGMVLVILFRTIEAFELRDPHTNWSRKCLLCIELFDVAEDNALLLLIDIEDG